MSKTASSKSSKTKKQTKLPSLSSRRFGKPAIFAALFAFVGVVTLLASFAASPSGTIVNKQSGECLENFFNRQLNTNFISTYRCDANNQAQKWTLAGDGSIRTAENFCLEIPNGTKEVGTRIWLWQCNDSVGQKWEALSNGTIRNPNSGLCMETTVEDTLLAGPNILMQACNANNQRQVWTVPTSPIPVPVPTPPPSNPPSNTTPSGAVDVKSSCRNINSAVANGTQVRTGRPSDVNTGPQAGGYNETKLTASGRSGKWVITQAGSVVDHVYHNGTIEVNANNVTIKNSVICGVGTLIIRNNAQNLTIENSIIRGERGGGAINSNTGEPCAATVGYANYTVRRSEMAGCADGAKLGHRVEIYDSWFHDSYTNRFGGGAGTHNDTVQKNDDTPLSSLVFRGNAAYADPCTSNRHFQLKSKSGQSAQSIIIENNFFYGITGIMMDGFTTASGVVSGNVFAGSATQGPFNNGSLYAGGGNGTLRKQGNLFESRQPANDNPSGYQCAPS